MHITDKGKSLKPYAKLSDPCQPCLCEIEFEASLPADFDHHQDDPKALEDFIRAKYIQRKVRHTMAARDTNRESRSSI